MKFYSFILTLFFSLIIYAQVPDQFPDGIETDVLKANSLINKGFNSSSVVLLGNGTVRGVDTFGQISQHATFANFPAIGRVDNLYVALDTNSTYAWNGTIYIQVGGQDSVWGTISGDITNQTDLAPYLKFTNGTNPLNAVYLGGNVGVGKQPTQPLDVAGNIGLDGNQIQTSNTQLKLEQIGGSFSGSYLNLESSSGIVGAVFGSNGIDFTDFAFNPSAGYRGFLRYEHRSGFIFGGSDQTTGEFQFWDTSINNIPLVINKNVTAVRLGQFAVGTSTPVASAKMQVDSETQGFLPPRMTQANRLSISSPTNGLLVHQTNGVSGYYIYNSTWQKLYTETDFTNAFATVLPKKTTNNTSTIVLTTSGGDYRNDTENSASNYLVSIASGAPVGSFAKIRINRSTEPTVNGSSSTKRFGDTFQPNFPMDMIIYTDNQSGIYYKFERL